MKTPEESFTAMVGAIANMSVVRMLQTMDDEGRAKILNGLEPTCGHPTCIRAFRAILRVVNFCHKLNKSPEFKELVRLTNEDAEAVHLADKLHEQRN